jgi:hypothetical protein
MTATEFAALVDARRTKPGTWQAHCPAHQDRSPSLSIHAGSEGRVLIHCHAGCSPLAIAVSLGLSMCDLFAGTVPPSPAELAALRIVREERERKTRAEREARIAAFDRVRRWEAAATELGAKLARAPEDEELGRVFHLACERLHRAETEADEWTRRICPKWRAGE